MITSIKSSIYFQIGMLLWKLEVQKKRELGRKAKKINS